MARKNKKNLKQLAAKKQQLQALPSENLPVTPVLTSSTNNLTPAIAAPSSPQQLPAFHPAKEVIRTLVSLVIIGILLTGVVYSDQRRPFLADLGNRIYDSLELGQ